MAYFDKNSRDYFERKKQAAKNEISSFISHYRDVSEYIQPRRGRFLVTDVNKGGSRYGKIINSKATWAHRVCRSGLLNGTMSPARPWVSLETQDPDMMEYQPVKIWLTSTAELFRDILNASNFYNMAQVLLGELILFGTGNMAHLKNFETVARFQTHTAGSYMLQQDNLGRVNGSIREYRMTTEQLIEEFGLEKISLSARNAYDRGDYCVWFDVTEIIEPNPNYDESKKLSKYKKFRSVKYQPDDVDKKFLSESGYDRFPNYCPRWDVTGEDTYGTDCPGMTALGDVTGLQLEERRKAQAIDKMVNPPLKGPATLRNVPISSLPGGATLFDSFQGGGSLEPIYRVEPRINELMLDIQAVERRIDNAFYVDVFQAFASMEGIQPRNQFDLARRDGERMVQLGPVLERIHGEFLSPLIENLFADSAEAGILPPPPPELQGQALRVKFISPLAMAQRELATGGIDRVAAFTGGLMQAGLSDGKKFDGDQAIDEYAMAVGAPPRVVVPDEVVAERREKEAQIAQMAQASQMASATADTGQKLAASQAVEKT